MGCEDKKVIDEFYWLSHGFHPYIKEDYFNLFP